MQKGVLNLSTKISTFFSAIEGSPSTYGTWLISVMSLILARIFIENWVSGIQTTTTGLLFVSVTHFAFSLLLTVLLFVPLVTWGAKIPVSVASRIVLFGFVIVLTPPLIDTWIAGGGHFVNFYKFDGLSGWFDGHGLPLRFLTFFGDRPDFGVTYGVRIEIAFSILFLSLYTYFKTRQWRKSLLVAFFGYSIFFFLGTFPSWVALVVEGWKNGVGSVSDISIAQLFFTPEGVFSEPTLDFSGILNFKMSLVYGVILPLVVTIEAGYFFPRVLQSLMRNARWPQILYHSGLMCVGMGLSVVFSGGRVEWTFFNTLAFIVLQFAIWSAWLAAVIINDIVDIRIDRLTNPLRPLPTQAVPEDTYQSIGYTFFGASILLAGCVSPKLAIVLVIYQIFAWMYSAWPLRLKRVPVLGTLISAATGLMIIYIGFMLVAPEGTIERFPLPISLFLLISLTIVLAVKDFKDIEGDRADGVYTVPVIFGEDAARIILGIGTWLVYAASMIVIHESRLFIPSILFGGVSFFTILAANKEASGWLHFRSLPAWLFLITFIYGVVLTWIIFR